jgi:large subunit ribosomal protein L6
MSRIGKKPISVPAGVKFVQDQATLSVEGPRGKLSMEVPPDIEVTLAKEAIMVNRISDSRKARSYHGLVRTLVGNMVTGVSTGFEKGLGSVWRRLSC